MEMTIKQLASELGVSKPTVRSVIAELGFHDKLRKVGNRYMLSDMQISEIKSKMSNKSENEVHSELEKTEKSKNEIQPKSEKTEKSESEVQLKSEKTENNIFIEQLLNKQLAVKDEQITMFQAQLAVKDRQINLLQEQISQLTAAMENLTASLNAEQALHAGTIQKQLAEHSVMDQPSDVEQPKQKQGLFSRLFGRKKNGFYDKVFEFSKSHLKKFINITKTPLKKFYIRV